MDINKVIEIIREAKKASKCPPGFKYSKKKKSCVAVRKKGNYVRVRGYLGSDIVVEIIDQIVVMVIMVMVTVVMVMAMVVMVVVMEEVEENEILQ